MVLNRIKELRKIKRRSDTDLQRIVKVLIAAVGNAARSGSGVMNEIIDTTVIGDYLFGKAL